MMSSINEYVLLKMPPEERLDYCKKILMTEKDESLRWDAVWLVGEMAEKAGKNDPLFDKAADLMSWVLENDDNGVVKHEACYQIAMRKMVNKIPDLFKSIRNDKNGLVLHESIEALGLLNAYDSKEILLEGLKSSNEDVKQTAQFVLGRLSRLENKKAQAKNYHL